MISYRIFLNAVIGCIVLGQATWADELDQKNRWVRQHLSAESGVPSRFFSFSIGGKPSDAWLPSCLRKAEHKRLDDRRTEHIITWTHGESGLAVCCRAIEYHDFPTVEWTLSLKNAGTGDTPILADLRALDLAIRRVGKAEFVLHHHTGDNCSAASYEPHATRLGPKSAHDFAPAGGRPTNGAYPYFNVEYDGGGLIAVLGWPGQWSARFDRDEALGLRISGGQERTHFKLLSGEEVRSPLVVLQFWTGDRIRSQNTWRRWMIAHNLPRPGGKLPPPFTSSCMGLHQSETSEIGFIDSYVHGGAKLDYWWMDAGWYPCRDWPETGTWEPDPKRFPRGIRAVSDYAHTKNMKLVLWFEPERVHAGSWLFRERPQWLLGQGDDRLLNLGNPEARQWLTQHIDTFLTREGIDLYRQDFNIDPLGFWRANDPPDRQGITEIRHVEGYLAFWDELRRRHPNMLIDSCASGGRRNDLETLRRAVPLLRSDFQAPQNPSDPTMLVGNQGHTYGLSFWVPYYGTGVYYDDVYALRSHLTPSLGIGYRGGEAVDWAKMRRRFADWKTVAAYFYGDYYPLTPYNRSENRWIAWQFHQPETGEGMIQAFRRTKSDEPTATLRLYGLESDAVYEFRDLDRETRTRCKGDALTHQGLTVTLPQPRQAALITYRPIKGLAAVVTTTVDKCQVLQQIAFSGQSSGTSQGDIAGYHWDFGDGATADRPTATHRYATPGTYTVRLIVRDGRGNKDTTGKLIVVSPVDTTLPTIIGVASGDREKVTVTFSKPVELAGAEKASNYAIDHEVRVLSVSLAPDLVTVTLATSRLEQGTTYTLSARNVRDRAYHVHTIVPAPPHHFRYTGLYAWWKLNDGQGDRAVDFLPYQETLKPKYQAGSAVRDGASDRPSTQEG